MDVVGTLGQFFRGRPPGQSFGACVAQNVSLTLTGSTHNSKVISMIVGVSGIAGSMLTFIKAPGGDAPLSFAIAFSAVRIVGVTDLQLLQSAPKLASQGVAVLGGAGIGLLLGSGVNCASESVNP